MSSGWRRSKRSSSPQPSRRMGPKLELALFLLMVAVLAALIVYALSA